MQTMCEGVEVLNVPFMALDSFCFFFRILNLLLSLNDSRFRSFLYFLSVIKSVLNDLFQHPCKHIDKHSHSLQKLQPK